MNRYKKLKIIHVMALVCLWIDILISITISSDFFFLQIHIILKIFLFLISVSIVSICFALLINFIFKKMLNKSLSSDKIIILNVNKCLKINLPYLKLNDNSTSYYLLKHGLATISIHYLDIYEIKKIKLYFKKCRENIKNNIKIANEKQIQEKNIGNMKLI